ncbi:MAG: RNA polymerase sigma factor [Acidimicrobiales bacterium]|nr:RNA polymerase sigma factor [Acidimicrobiales bacterium]
MPEPDPLAALAHQAVSGDAAALDALCRELQDPIYRLAMRMFAHPEDAADATQEALIRIVTHLASFEGRSKVTTWAHTVASRHFLRMRTQRLEPTVAGPEEFGDWIDRHRSEPSAETASLVEFDELCGDVRIACTYGMLLCLSRPVRLAYLLGDVIGLTDVEGAEACETTPAAFRQRLARARRTMRSIMAQRCGLIRSENPCRCSHLVDASIEAGILDPAQPLHAHHAGAGASIDHGVIMAAAAELDLAEAIAEVYRTDPEWTGPDRIMSTIRASLPTLLQT